MVDLLDLQLTRGRKTWRVAGPLVVVAVDHVDPVKHASCRLICVLVLSTAFPRDELVVLNYAQRGLLSESRKHIAAVSLFRSSCLSHCEVLTPVAASWRACPIFQLLLMHLDVRLVDHHLRRASLLGVTIVLDLVGSRCLLLARCCVGQSAPASLTRFSTLDSV